LVDAACTEEKEIIILGDLNCDTTAKKLSTESNQMHELFNIYQLTQLIKDFTRITENASTLIDLAFTNDNGKITDSGVIDCPISDHSLIYAIRRPKITKN